MKKLNLLLAAVFAMGFMLQGSAQAQQGAAKDDLFAGTEIFEKNATDVTEITMDPDSLSMVQGKDKPKAQNTVLKVVRTYTYDKPGMYNIADVDKFRQKLNTGEWHCSIRQRSLKTGESTDVCNKRRADDLFESAIITVEPKSLTFIHTISHHSSMIGMPGMGEMGMGVNFGPLSSLAMLDPEMLELRMQLNSLKAFRLSPTVPLMLNRRDMPQLDSDAIEKAIEKAKEAHKDWEKSGKNFKEFTSPDGKHTFILTPDVLQALPAPQPAPATQTVPQTAPTPQVQ
jgi:hypothetical protein